MSELLTGHTINETIKTYGDAHELELWQEFSAAMNGSDISRWLYNGGTITASSTGRLTLAITSAIESPKHTT